MDNTYFVECVRCTDQLLCVLEDNIGDANDFYLISYVMKEVFVYLGRIEFIVECTDGTEESGFPCPVTNEMRMQALELRIRIRKIIDLVY